MYEALSFFNIFFFCALNSNAQTYQSAKAFTFIDIFLKDNYSNTTKKKHIEIYPYSDLMPSMGGKTSIYKSLSDLFSPNEIDVFFNECREISINFTWENLKLIDVKVISEQEAVNIVQNATTKIVRVHHKKFFRRRREEVIKHLDTTNMVFKFSPPIFIKDQFCLIKCSTIYGNTKGSTCLYLYKKNTNGDWVKVKSFSCSVS